MLGMIYKNDNEAIEFIVSITKEKKILINIDKINIYTYIDRNNIDYYKALIYSDCYSLYQFIDFEALCYNIITMFLSWRSTFPHKCNRSFLAKIKRITNEFSGLNFIYVRFLSKIDTLIDLV